MTRAEARRRARELPRLRAATEDLRRVILEAKDPPHDSIKALSVPVIAARAGVSKRTVYRIIEDDPEPTKTLDLADRICTALDRPLDDIRLLEEPCRTPDRNRP